MCRNRNRKKDVKKTQNEHKTNVLHIAKCQRWQSPMSIKAPLGAAVIHQPTSFVAALGAVVYP